MGLHWYYMKDEDMFGHSNKLILKFKVTYMKKRSSKLPLNIQIFVIFSLATIAKDFKFHISCLFLQSHNRLKISHEELFKNFKKNWEKFIFDVFGYHGNTFKLFICHPPPKKNKFHNLKNHNIMFRIIHFV